MTIRAVVANSILVPIVARRGGDDRLERPLLAADMTFFCIYRIFRTDVLANDPHIR